MSRNALAAGAMLLLAALSWIVVAWPAPDDDAALEPLDPPAEGPASDPAVPAAPVAVAAEEEEDPPEPPEEPPAAVAVAPPPAEEPAFAEPPATAEPPDMFAEDQGPVAEYRRAFESEPRDSAASGVESSIRAAFSHPEEATPELYRSVLCRETVCKLELNWSPDRTGAYVAGITRALVTVLPEVAVSPAGPPGPNGERRLEVYLKRAAPGQQPAAALAAAAAQPTAANAPAAAPAEGSATPEEPPPSAAAAESE